MRSHLDTSKCDTLSKVKYVLWKHTRRIWWPYLSPNKSLKYEYILADPSGQSSPAMSMFWRSWCFGLTNDLVWSLFQRNWCFGMVDVSVWLIFWNGWCLRFLRECHSPARLIFQCHLCYSLVNVWGSSRNEKLA